jgi:hypothetical protein
MLQVTNGKMCAALIACCLEKRFLDFSVPASHMMVIFSGFTKVRNDRLILGANGVLLVLLHEFLINFLLQI